MKAIANLIFLVSFVIASLWYCGFMDGETLPTKHVHWEHQHRQADPSSDLAELNSLIDKSVAQAEAHKVPKNAVAMLELYGTPTEQRWADNVAKGN
jgi:hypothetical protein